MSFRNSAELKVNKFTMATKLIIFFCVIFLFIYQFRSAQAMENYGDECYKNTCDYSMHLFCINRRCDCSSLDMIYNKTLESCVVKLFHKCVQEESYTNKDGELLSKTIKLVRRLPCV